MTFGLAAPVVRLELSVSGLLAELEMVAGFGSAESVPEPAESESPGSE